MSKIFRHVSDTDVIHMLAFIGGFVDAAGYIKIRGVFTSSITGNLVVACASVSSLNGVICRACVSIAFAAGAGVSAMVALKLRMAHQIDIKYLAMTLFSLEIGMLVIAWAAGIQLDDLIINSVSLDDWPVVLLGCFLGAAMGFHNVAAKESISGCPPTTVMTSTLINVSSGISNSITMFFASLGLFRLTPPTGLRGQYLPLTNDESNGLQSNSLEAFVKTLPLIRPLIAFLVGAIIGAVTMKFGTFHCLSIPIFILLVIQFEIVMKIMSVEKVAGKVDIEGQLTAYSIGFNGQNVILKSEVVKKKEPIIESTERLILDAEGVAPVPPHPLHMHPHSPEVLERVDDIPSAKEEVIIT